MKKLIMALATVVSFSATAADVKENLICSFTEPFISYTYNPNDNTVLFDGLGEEVEVYTNVTVTEIPDEPLYEGHFDESTRRWSYGSWEIKTSEGETLVKFSLDFGGSDGMSDLNFAFTGVAIQGFSEERPLIGGCRSESLPALHPYTGIEAVGLPYEF